MGNCMSMFRATFKPNEPLQDSPMKPLGVSAKPETLPKPPTTSDDESVDVLKVTSVDLCYSENGLLHHTSQYDLMERTENPRLVVRRGQNFFIDVTFSRAYDGEKDAISFVFSSVDAKKPNYGQGSLIVAPLVGKEEDPVGSWSARIESTSGNSIKAQVTTSAYAIVGQWTLDIDTKLKSDGSLSYSHRDPIYILFNPWCKQDLVYMDDEDCRKEYVLNDTGLIWRGSHNRPRPCVWAYGQFEEDVLDCCLYLLGKIGKLGVSARADPVKTVRAISAAVNSPDDSGVLVGNWSGDYARGTPPTKWAGSIMILQQFYKTKKPVKFGQCWVFSGITTSVCRALGIPARSVTNFASAHDTQNSLTIDYFMDDEGEAMESLITDSVWNFHVWNEVWIERPDLEPGGYGEWQAIDATPQEESEGLYCCGPASVQAVKRGEIRKGYDAPFVFAEVNADKVYWRYYGASQPLKLLAKRQDMIGRNISTKAVGKFEREDITANYKYTEKSEEERAAMLKALKQCESLFSRYYLNEDFNDVEFDFQLRDDIIIGQPFSVILKVQNKNNEKDYTVNVSLRVDTVLYTGRFQGLVKKQKFQKTIAAGTEEELKFDVTYDEYYNKLVDQCAFNIAAMASVEESSFEYFAQDDFRIRKPDVKIETEGELIQGQEFSGTASLTNPLPIALKKAQFIIEGPGLGEALTINLKGNIEPGAVATTSFKMKPKSPGEKTIAAKFVSRELEDVDGFLVLQVLPKKEQQNGTGNSSEHNAV